MSRGPLSSGSCGIPKVTSGSFLRSKTRGTIGNRSTQLKSPYKDGTTHIVMEPLEFMERLTALVPCPRLHLMADCRRAFASVSNAIE